MIVSIIVMLLATVGFTAFYYFAYPYIFPTDAMPWAFFITFCIVNAIALLLSWIYFDRTTCYQDEGNPIAMIFYYIFGHDVAHIFLAIFRICSTIGFYFSVFGLDFDLLGISLHIPPQDILFLALPTAIFTTELCFNIYAVTNHWDEKCKPDQPMICPCRGQDGCYCDIEKMHRIGD